MWVTQFSIIKIVSFLSTKEINAVIRELIRFVIWFFNEFILLKVVMII